MKKRFLIPIFIAAAAVLGIFLYASDYYHTQAEADASLKDTQNVRVVSIDGGLYFDGPEENRAMIFYPGGKVEYTAYAPLLHRLAENGPDCFLLRMPLNLAILGINRAEAVLRRYGYREWYLGGHSLGGAAAAMFAAGHDLDGLVLLAAYPTREIDEPALEIYGSRDGVLNAAKREAGDRYLPEGSAVRVIEGGNHAQFGCYGEQKKDGRAEISREEQQRMTVDLILDFLNGSVQED